MTNSVPPPKKPNTTNHGPDSLPAKPAVPPPPPIKIIKEGNFINDLHIATIALIIILGPVSVAIYQISDDWTLLFLVAIASVYLISKPYFEKLARRIS